VRVAEVPYFSEAPLYVAQEEGYFAAENIDVELRRVPVASPASVAAMLRGDIDVDTGAPHVVTFNAMARGAGIRWVADKGHIELGPCTQWALVVRRALLDSRGGLDPAQLRGARTRNTPGTYTSYLIDRGLRLDGFRLDDLTRTAVPSEILEQALERGEIDLSNLSEIPLVKAAQARDLVVFRRLADYDPHAALSGLMFGPRLLGPDREVGIRFLVAYLRGVRALAAGKTERNLDILSRRIGMTIADLRACCWLSFRPDGRLDTDDWVEFERWAAARGELDRVLAPTEFADTTLVEEARRRLDARR